MILVGFCRVHFVLCLLALVSGLNHHLHSFFCGHSMLSTYKAAHEVEQKQCISLEDWMTCARQHTKSLDAVLYPPLDAADLALPRTVQLKKRTHMISQHPIYNFLHSYYRYSASSLYKYSPGLGVELAGAQRKMHGDVLNEKFMMFTPVGGEYDISTVAYAPKGRHGWIQLLRNYEILKEVSDRPPFFGCFGLHEWAMLYAQEGISMERHQKALPLRVSQDTINAVVKAPGQLKCTHFDGWRFFHPAAQLLNSIHPQSRNSQMKYEQPGCVHANMDLFKYATDLYPFISSELLVAALEVAIQARKIDMRASPYDVSAYMSATELPICVETAEGRALYVQEQQKIADAAVPVRARLIGAHRVFLQSIAPILTGSKNDLEAKSNLLDEQNKN